MLASQTTNLGADRLISACIGNEDDPSRSWIPFTDKQPTSSTPWLPLRPRVPMNSVLPDYRTATVYKTVIRTAWNRLLRPMFFSDCCETSDNWQIPMYKVFLKLRGTYSIAPKVFLGNLSTPCHHLSPTNPRHPERKFVTQLRLRFELVVLRTWLEHRNDVILNNARQSLFVSGNIVEI